MGSKQFAVVTGASSGLGLELAKAAARRGYDLFVAANEDGIETAADVLRGLGAQVTSTQADFTTISGVHELYEEIAAVGRPVDLFVASAGLGLAGGFLDQDFDDWRRMVDTNIVGTLYLIQRVGDDMRARGGGRILVTGANGEPDTTGSLRAVWNASRVFLEAFVRDLGRELSAVNIKATWLDATSTTHGAAMGSSRDRNGDATEASTSNESLARYSLDALIKQDASVESPLRTSSSDAADLAER